MRIIGSSVRSSILEHLGGSSMLVHNTSPYIQMVAPAASSPLTTTHLFIPLQPVAISTPLPPMKNGFPRSLENLSRDSSGLFLVASYSHEKKTKYTSDYLQLLLPPRHPKQTNENHKQTHPNPNNQPQRPRGSSMLTRACFLFPFYI